MFIWILIYCFTWLLRKRSEYFFLHWHMYKLILSWTQRSVRDNTLYENMRANKPRHHKFILGFLIKLCQRGKKSDNNLKTLSWPAPFFGKLWCVAVFWLSVSQHYEIKPITWINHPWPQHQSVKRPVSDHDGVSCGTKKAAQALFEEVILLQNRFGLLVWFLSF